MLGPSFGAVVCKDGVRFRVHAPAADTVRLVLHGGRARGEHTMLRDGEGVWDLLLSDASAGDLYSLRLDGGDPLPDPASRFQPEGVHGPSEVVDPAEFRWSDAGWRGVPETALVIYELHVGTFSESGTFAGARGLLPYLRDLGITAIELMPLADFAGMRNWGYDGVALYAPSRAYGRPDDLRALVDHAHALGLAVFLDVVYNHLGPEGAYLPRVNPEYLLGRTTPWGAAVNLDGPGSALVRRFIIDNAVHWVREYHFDGLRLDATHALLDESPRPFLREFSETVTAAGVNPVLLHAEDHRNLDRIVLRDPPDGWGFDGVWADDFHHVVRRMVAGDEHSYYQDFDGTMAELARTIRQGWLFSGEPSRHLKTRRGTDASAIPMNRFIVCVQNHDQIGNRAFGERLHHRVDAATWRAASVLLLTVPMTPLLFMGQEWAASSPFLFFTDLEPGLGRLVTEGRRREFSDFPEFWRPESRERIPDPQSRHTFESSKLRWDERAGAGHSAVLALYRELLRLRRTEAALQASTGLAGEAFAADENTLLVRRTDGRTTFWIAIRLRGCGRVDLSPFRDSAAEASETWETVLTTEDPEMVTDGVQPIRVEGRGPVVEFARPGAAVLKFAGSES